MGKGVSWLWGPWSDDRKIDFGGESFAPVVLRVEEDETEESLRGWQ
jgi:hypothetical protein